MSVRNRGYLDITFPERIALRQSMSLFWGGAGAFLTIITENRKMN